LNLGRPCLLCHIVSVSAFILTGAAGPGLTRLTGMEGGIESGALQGYDLDPSDRIQFQLGRSITEISGLAIDARGRLFGHNDERAIVTQLDPATGDAVKSFRVGRNGVRGDFEGITFAGSRLFLISSGGDLLEFGEGADDQSVEYIKTEIQSDRVCDEIEGLDYDASWNALLLACKFTRGKALRDRMVVLRFSLRTRQLEAEPAFSIPLDFLADADLPAELSPSGLALHPVTRTIFLIAAREHLIVELDRAGTVLGLARLGRKAHPQAEGIAFAKDGTMYIADEGGSGRATLTVYPYRGSMEPTRPANPTFE